MTDWKVFCALGAIVAVAFIFIMTRKNRIAVDKKVSVQEKKVSPTPPLSKPVSEEKEVEINPKSHPEYADPKLNQDLRGRWDFIGMPHIPAFSEVELRPFYVDQFLGLLIDPRAGGKTLFTQYGIDYIVNGARGPEQLLVVLRYAVKLKLPDNPPEVDFQDFFLGIIHLLEDAKVATSPNIENMFIEGSRNSVSSTTILALAAFYSSIRHQLGMNDQESTVKDSRSKARHILLESVRTLLSMLGGNGPWLDHLSKAEDTILAGELAEYFVSKIPKEFYDQTDKYQQQNLVSMNASIACLRKLKMREDIEQIVDIYRIPISTHHPEVMIREYDFKERVEALPVSNRARSFRMKAKRAKQLNRLLGAKL